MNKHTITMLAIIMVLAGLVTGLMIRCNTYQQQIKIMEINLQRYYVHDKGAVFVGIRPYSDKIKTPSFSKGQ